MEVSISQYRNVRHFPFLNIILINLCFIRLLC
jgi:hypothetical protein